ncbi:MAG: orotate phosphoribosyltransferase [SAR116 cluster bacterium MED-G04]|jgi:orotate phosphoribosyltransferase|nr:MAG: orotate phosphoribosyltransferase [SAR116 cluster bacterium MED-G04]CAI8322087.1 MAG: Orotate phosphoribosyltransferase [SAR116 cluster bacterium MED-G04]HCD50149.1 orotate phosphoribosyltransferase [Alphaproteobacteria bacterium]HCV62727.1 orotate phosphoribosyltransferase [Alphaproteobacteria bacterium]|tara:strand:- start:291 stop:977 length:687 start_codon:yes stop_codon:yes gene_type:complete
MLHTTYPDQAQMARATARMLLEIDAVHFRADPPFTLTSGATSPVYIDCRKLISFPRIRSMLMDFGVASVLEKAGYEAFDSVAGGETAGIPFAAWFAERMGLPMQYVRKKPKGFGRDAQIEGHLLEGDRVLLVEDLATDGGSKIAFVDALRKAGAECNHTFVVFFYDIFPETAEIMADAGLTLHYLTTWRSVLEAAKEADHLDAATIKAVGDFLDAPREWSAANGGVEA